MRSDFDYLTTQLNSAEYKSISDMRDEACQENNVQAMVGTHKEQDQGSSTAWSLIEENREKKKQRKLYFLVYCLVFFNHS